MDCSSSVAAAALLLSVSLLLPAKVIAQNGREAGFVLTVNGEWFAGSDSSRPLSAGRRLSEGETVRAGPRTGRSGYLTVALRDGRRLDLRCTTPVLCQRDQRIRTSRSLFARAGTIFDAVASLFPSSPERYVMPITRGSTGLREAVIIRGDSGVDLAPALEGLPPGDLQLEAAALVSPEGFSPPSEWMPLKVQWEPGAAAFVARVQLQPGLYAVRTAGEPDTEAWVLVRDSPDYEHDAADFVKARSLVCSWDGRDAQDDALSFLRAYLHHLSQRGASLPGQGGR